MRMWCQQQQGYVNIEGQRYTFGLFVLFRAVFPKAGLRDPLTVQRAGREQKHVLPRDPQGLG